MRACVAAAFLALPFAVRADGLADNNADKVRPVPPPGIAIPEKDRAELQKGADALGQEIGSLRKALAKQPALLALLPDVQIFHNAVRYALAYNEFYDLKELTIARDFLAQGMKRAEQLRKGQSPWTTATGLVVRGYLSKIDGSVQPYGLAVPESFNPRTPYKHRLDLWCHGRGEKLTELNFLNGRQRSPGEFTPAHAFVLHLYGRYCNANKLAGEIDGLEAMAHVKTHYPIDDNRVVVRGFSMGGAACWQFAVHYPDLWAAAAPGAGFSETPEFLKFFQKETLNPTPWEKKLWHLYDCTDYAQNIFNVPTVAYSGENDIQKQAADIMESELARKGIRLRHIIGPKTGHSYHPAAKSEINQRIDALAARGRESVPAKIRFATYTLRYNRCAYLTIDALEKHWEEATIDCWLGVVGASAHIKTKNIAKFTIELAPGQCDNAGEEAGFEFDIDDQAGLEASELQIKPAMPYSDRALIVSFRKTVKGWEQVSQRDKDSGLRKRHGLQGPIDDAFLDSFLIVRPTGKASHEKAGAWADAEMNRAIVHWRKQFRGEARVKTDDAVSADDIANHNLVLWGDPASNKVLARIADQLPIRWDADKLRVGAKEYDVAHHAPILIYPNPLNPKRYVVLNSGFTFRDYDYLNNARQVPKLPDWAVIDLSTPPNSRWPGKVVDAGFFDDKWQLGK